MTNFCTCCDRQIVEEVTLADPYDEGEVSVYCSWGCVDYCEKEHQESLKKYENETNLEGGNKC